MSFSNLDYKQQFQGQRRDGEDYGEEEEQESKEDEQENEEEQEEEDDEDDEEIGKMKAKFDKIMATFAEENKKPQKGEYNSASNLMDKEQLIMEYKNKNMQKK